MEKEALRTRCHKESIAPEERTAWSQTGMSPDNITRRERPVITASPLTGTSDTQMRPDWILLSQSTPGGAEMSHPR